eukprot:351612-Chlamydomonas_euryale.AAC.2
MTNQHTSAAASCSPTQDVLRDRGACLCTTTSRVDRHATWVGGHSETSPTCVTCHVFQLYNNAVSQLPTHADVGVQAERTHEGCACAERSKTAGVEERAGQCYKGNATARKPEPLHQLANRDGNNPGHEGKDIRLPVTAAKFTWFSCHHVSVRGQNRLTCGWHSKIDATISNSLAAHC